MPSYRAVRAVPRMLSATTRAWYIARWVNGMTPVTSPIAQIPSPGAAAAVDDDLAVLAELDADGVQAKAGSARGPAGPDDDDVAAQLLAAVELDDGVVAVPARSRGSPAGAEVHALVPEVLLGQLADPALLA
jgi:hypothetical protein